MTRSPSANHSSHAHVALITLVALFGLASSVLAEAPQQRLLASHFKVNQADPESSVPTPEQAMQMPLEMGYFLMDLADLAERAEKQGEYAKAIPFYKAMAKAVPDRSISFSKQCTDYQLLGDRKNAIDTCRQALGLGGVTVGDHEHFVNVVLEGSAPLSAEEIGDVDAIAAHFQHEAKGNKELLMLSGRLACQLAVRLGDNQRLRACTKQLDAVAPADATTLTFHWALAMGEHDAARVERVIAEATRAKAPSALLGKMNDGLRTLRAAEAQRSVWGRLGLPAWLVQAVVVLCGFGVLAMSVVVTRRRSSRPA